MWLLTGLAVRMGQRLGLNSSDARESIFETQMRRRIWWQILLIDGRSAQIASNHFPFPSSSLFSPLPANLNDADLTPEMTEQPPPHRGPTEMLFCLCRYEFGRFLHTSGAALHDPRVPFEEKDRLINELERRLEDDYLGHCDPALPVHTMAAGGARSGIAKLRLMAHHPTHYRARGVAMSPAVRATLFSESSWMVQVAVEGVSSPKIAAFRWHVDVYFQLDALVFMLIEARNQPPGPEVDRAWRLVGEAYRCQPELMRGRGGGGRDIKLTAAVRDLTLRAWSARQAQLARASLAAVPEPPFIAELRHWRGADAGVGASAPPAGSAARAGPSVDGSTSAGAGLAAAQTAASVQMPDADLGDTGMSTGGAEDLDSGVSGFVGLDSGAYSVPEVGDYAMSGWEDVDWGFWELLGSANLGQQ